MKGDLVREICAHVFVEYCLFCPLFFFVNIGILSEIYLLYKGIVFLSMLVELAVERNLYIMP